MKQLKSFKTVILYTSLKEVKYFVREDILFKRRFDLLTGYLLIHGKGFKDKS